MNKYVSVGWRRPYDQWGDGVAIVVLTFGAFFFVAGFITVMEQVSSHPERSALGLVGLVLFAVLWIGGGVRSARRGICFAR
jgi:hypothetical protein